MPELRVNELKDGVCRFAKSCDGLVRWSGGDSYVDCGSWEKKLWATCGASSDVDVGVLTQEKETS